MHTEAVGIIVCDGGKAGLAIDESVRICELKEIMQDDAPIKAGM